MALSMNAASAFSAGASIATTLAGGSADRANIKATGEAARANIGYAKNDYIRRSEVSFQQEQAIDREMGSMLSQRGLEAMKTEARLRAGSAGTGLSGASMEEVVDQSGYDQLLDNEVIIARSRSSKLDTQRTRLADYMNFKGITNNAVQGTNISTPNSFLAGINSGLGVIAGIQSLTGQSLFANSGSSDALSGYKSVLER